MKTIRLFSKSLQIKSFSKSLSCKNTFDTFKYNFPIASTPFSEEIVKILHSPIQENDIEVKADGSLYLPDIEYRKMLNSAFGHGGWAIIPVSKPQTIGNNMIQDYALFCNGQLVSQCFGEASEDDKLIKTGPTGFEAIKSDALMRCCKDLGVAPQLWELNFSKTWMETHAVKVWCENVTTKQKRLLARRKDRPVFEYPWKEIGKQDQAVETQTLVWDSPKKTPVKQELSLDEILKRETDKILNQPIDPVQQSLHELGIELNPIATKGEEMTEKSESVDMFATFELMNSTKADAGVRQERGKSAFDIIGNINFGKYKGRAWKDVLEEKKIEDYLSWLANKSTTDYLKQTGKDALEYISNKRV